MDGSNSLSLAAQQVPTSFDGIQALGFDGCPLCKIWPAHCNLANSIEQDLSSLLSKSSLHIRMKHMGPRKIWNTGWFISSAWETNGNPLAEEFLLMSDAKCSLWWRGMMSRLCSSGAEDSATRNECPENCSKSGGEWLDKIYSFADTQTGVFLRCIPTTKRLLKGQRSYRALQQQVTPKADPYPGNHSAVHVLASAPYLGASAYCGAFIFQDDMPDNFILLHWKQVQHDYLMLSLIHI